MCDECKKFCEELQQKIGDLITKVTGVLEENQAGNDEVFMVGAELMMLAVKAMCMPPEVFTQLMCSMYSDVVGMAIIPVSMTRVPISEPEETDDKRKPN
jgi:hypothetical protein